MSRTIVVSDAFFAELQTIAGSPIYAPNPAPQGQLPVPPKAPSTLMLPVELLSRSRMELALPWGAPAGQNRIVSPKPLDASNVFIGRFKTGATPFTARLQAAEFGGPSAQRNAALIRVYDGSVLAHYAGPVLTAIVTSAAPPPPGPFDAVIKPPVQLTSDVEYAFAIWNAPGVPASTMLMELYV